MFIGMEYRKLIKQNHPAGSGELPAGFLRSSQSTQTALSLVFVGSCSIGGVTQIIDLDASASFLRHLGGQQCVGQV